MIVQEFTLPRVGWRVTVYYSVTCYYIYEILNALREAECDEQTMREAYNSLYDCNLNTGFTYSNTKLRKSVMVISTASSGAEFNNSLQHEQRHLERHIAESLGIDANSEEAAYIAGDIAAAMFDHAKLLMCDNCRKRLVRKKRRVTW